MPFNLASDLQTRQIVWVRDGKIAPATVWASLARQGKI
jgi:hypothetical protein